MELANVMNKCGDSYRDSHKMSYDQHKAMNAIQACRTSFLGAHISECNTCHTQEISYNSCRNRHCPKCQSSKSLKWVKGKLERLLPVEWYHVVFTLPHELNELILHNKSDLYSLMFKHCSDTLKTFGNDPKWIGGEIGIISILHTWGQNLEFHPHIHCIVSAGGLSGSEWKKAQKKFLFPVKALSKVWKGKFMEDLKRHKNELVFPEKLTEVQWKNTLKIAYEKDWVVYAKSPFNSPERVMKYLGLYSHRVAISNARILEVKDGIVSFRYRDSKDGKKQKVMHLRAEEFIRRFLLHIIPKGFVRIRSYGILSNGNREKLQKAEEVLGEILEEVKKHIRTCIDELSTRLIQRCRTCKKGLMEFIGVIDDKMKVL